MTIKFQCYKIKYSYIDIRDGVIHSNMTVIGSSPDKAVKYVRSMYEPDEEFCLESVEVVE